MELPNSKSDYHVNFLPLPNFFHSFCRMNHVLQMLTYDCVGQDIKYMGCDEVKHEVGWRSWWASLISLLSEVTKEVKELNLYTRNQELHSSTTCILTKISVQNK